MDILRLILDYFTLEREFALPPNIGANIPMPADLTEPLPLVWQLALYLALLAGIIAQSYLDSLRLGEKWQLSRQTVIVGSILALLAFPVVYQSAGLDASQPTLVQIALVFAAGLGYQSAFMALLAPASTQRRTSTRRSSRRTSKKKRSSK